MKLTSQRPGSFVGLVALSSLIFASCPGRAQAPPKTNVEIAMEISIETCVEAEQKGSAERIGGRLEVQAGASKAISIIAKAKVKAEVIGEYSSWHGPSEADIGRVIASTNDCRAAIYRASLQSLDRERPPHRPQVVRPKIDPRKSATSGTLDRTERHVSAQGAPLYVYGIANRPVREDLNFLSGDHYRIRPFGCDDRPLPEPDAGSINCTVWVQSDTDLAIVKSGSRAELETTSGLHIRAYRFTVLNDVTMPGASAETLKKRVLGYGWLDSMVDKQFAIDAAQARQQVLISYFFRVDATSNVAAMDFTLGGNDPVTRFPVIVQK